MTKDYKLFVVKTPKNSAGWRMVANIYPWTLMKKYIGKDVQISLGSYATKERAIKAMKNEV